MVQRFIDKILGKPQQLRTLPEFVEYWQRDAAVDIGKKGQPAPQQRQDELVNLTVNTALEAIVFRHLQNAANTSGSVIKLLNTDLEIVRDSGRETLKDLGKQNNTPEVILQKLREGHHIITVKDLVNDETIAEYKKKSNAYKAKKTHHADYQIPDVQNLQRPEDPRITKFNDRFGKFYTLYETGEKPPERLQDKAVTQGGGIAKVRDINRITIIPQTVADEGAVAAMIANRFQSKADETPRFFDRDWQIKPHGYMDRKFSVALKHGFTNEEAENLARGGVAEIKIESPRMHEADTLTRAAYRVLRQFEVGDHVDSKLGAQAIIEAHNRQVESGTPENSPLVKLYGALEAAIHYYDTPKTKQTLGLNRKSHTEKNGAGTNTQNGKQEIQGILTVLKNLAQNLEPRLEGETTQNSDSSKNDVPILLEKIATNANNLILKINGMFLNRSAQDWKQLYFEKVAVQRTVPETSPVKS
jgi:hypothetical protein